MTVWVDADSCPKPVRAIIIRAAERRSVPTVFVADRELPDCISDDVSQIRMAIVPKGADSADDHITEHVAAGDLVVTRDILLASRLVPLGAVVIDDRGGMFTADAIRERVSMRSIMSTFRDAGLYFEQHRPCGPKDVQAFANCFDRELTRALKESE